MRKNQGIRRNSNGIPVMGTNGHIGYVREENGRFTAIDLQGRTAAHDTMKAATETFFAQWSYARPTYMR